MNSKRLTLAAMAAIACAAFTALPAHAQKVIKYAHFQPAKADAAALLTDIDGAEAELGRLADRIAREDVLLVPLGRVRSDRVRSELARHLLNLELVLSKLELMHGGGL